MSKTVAARPPNPKAGMKFLIGNGPMPRIVADQGVTDWSRRVAPSGWPVRPVRSLPVVDRLVM